MCVMSVFLHVSVYMNKSASRVARAASASASARRYIHLVHLDLESGYILYKIFCVYLLIIKRTICGCNL